MKKTKIFGLCLTGLILFVAGIFAGYFITIFQSNEKHEVYSQRQEELQIRTESYEPTCRELKELNNPKIIQKGNDMFLVKASQKRFIVFGLNVDPGEAPVTAWWGADRENALKQVCRD